MERFSHSEESALSWSSHPSTILLQDEKKVIHSEARLSHRKIVGENFSTFDHIYPLLNIMYFKSFATLV